MTSEIIQALQLALDAQFKAGAAIGRLETLIGQAEPKPTDDQPPDKEPG